MYIPIYVPTMRNRKFRNFNCDMNQNVLKFDKINVLAYS